MARSTSSPIAPRSPRSARARATAPRRSGSGISACRRAWRPPTGTARSRQARGPWASTTSMGWRRIPTTAPTASLKTKNSSAACPARRSSSPPKAPAGSSSRSRWTTSWKTSPRRPPTGSRPTARSRSSSTSPPTRCTGRLPPTRGSTPAATGPTATLSRSSTGAWANCSTRSIG